MVSIGRARTVALAIALAAFAIGGDARAAKGPKEQAQALFVEANQLFGDGDYLAALDKFKAAYAIYASPKILLNEAMTLRLLGKNIDAAETYEKYLGDSGADANKKAQVARAVKEIDAYLAHVELRPSEAEATITVDGRSAAARTSMRLDPGEHAMIAEKPGFGAAAINVRLVPGETRVIALTLRRPGEPPKPVERDPGAAQRTAGYLIGGAGVAAIIGSIVLSIAQVEKTSAAKSMCQKSTEVDAYFCGSSGTSAFDAATGLRTAATWTSVGGVVALAGGVALVLTAPKVKKENATPTSGVTVTARASLGGLSFVGSF